jgi:predicted RNA-binding Zn ribbon-like protein
MESIAEIPLIAGDVALDFVNTAEERSHPEAGDALKSPADLRTWGERSGLVSGSAAAGGDGRAELRRALEARELLYAIFLARARGHSASDAQLSALAELGAAAYRAANLELEEDGSVDWRWSRDELATIRHVVVAAAIDLLKAEPASRLKQCPGEQCGWFFLDTTKRGNRRWCSMSDCGQEAKDQRRRALREAR